ncbi:AIG2 family protein [Rippkaea orientalis PCC 8801]|uniref:AIG2 family protein n=1 Tax=Rippkaea orientalis (strain PCC 8801 / RF-1) TaxID=41431 RepID=B7K3B5_RIPO1|nr:gamma-glutamylcyclotransferase [Rippkaea orientalis]ACK64435.1 AIG2 family protein [Rippkaea orientalis PCC 8801]
MRVFVYGTLKPGERNYPIYCQNKVIEEIRVYTYGELYHLNLGYPGMTIGTRQVHGYLLVFADESVLEPLDRLEDYHPLRSPQDNQYLREVLTVYSLTGELLGETWGYRMTLEKVQQFGGQLVASGWWTENPKNHQLIEQTEEFPPQDG